VFSLTLIPCWPASRCRRRPSAEPWLLRLAHRAYAPLLAAALRFRAATLAGAAMLVVAAAVGATRLGGEFLPKLGEGPW